MQPGITLRDLVHAIPLYAIKQGLLTVEKKGKKNIFSGRILDVYKRQTVYHALGSEIDVVEMFDQVIPAADKDVVKRCV